MEENSVKLALDYIHGIPIDKKQIEREEILPLYYVAIYLEIDCLTNFIKTYVRKNYGTSLTSIFENANMVIRKLPEIITVKL